MSFHHRHPIITSAPFLCAVALTWAAAGTGLAGIPQNPQFMGVSTAFGGATQVLGHRLFATDPVPRPDDYPNVDDYVRAVLEWIYRNSGGKPGDLVGLEPSQMVAMVAARIAMPGVYDNKSPEELAALETAAHDLAGLKDPGVQFLLQMQLNALGNLMLDVLGK